MRKMGGIQEFLLGPLKVLVFLPTIFARMDIQILLGALGAVGFEPNTQLSAESGGNDFQLILQQSLAPPGGAPPGETREDLVMNPSEELTITEPNAQSKETDLVLAEANTSYAESLMASAVVNPALPAQTSEQVVPEQTSQSQVNAVASRVQENAEAVAKEQTQNDAISEALDANVVEYSETKVVSPKADSEATAVVVPQTQNAKVEEVVSEQVQPEAEEKVESENPKASEKSEQDQPSVQKDAQAVAARKPKNALEKVPGGKSEALTEAAKETSSSDIEEAKPEVRTKTAGEKEEVKASHVAEKAPAPAKESASEFKNNTSDRQPNPELKERTQDHLDAIAVKLQKEILLELNPLDMGPVEVKVSKTEDKVVAEFQTQNAAIARQLFDAQMELKTNMADSGLQLDGFSVSTGSEHQGSSEQFAQSRPQYFAGSLKETASPRQFAYSGSSAGVDIWI